MKRSNFIRLSLHFVATEEINILKTLNIFLKAGQKKNNRMYALILSTVLSVLYLLNHIWLKAKGRDLTQYYDKTPTSTENQKRRVTTHKRHQNIRLRNDCGPT